MNNTKKKKKKDQEGYGGAVLMDLSKAFDTSNHDLLLAKVHAYGFNRDSIKVLHSDLSNRSPRTKVVVLGPLLFNIRIHGLFYLTELTDVCNFTDHTTFHACDSSLEDLINRLEHDANLVIEWLDCMNRCNLNISGQKSETIWAKIGQTKIWESKNQKLLEVIIDRQLNFDEYLISLFKKAGKKLSALARLTNLISLEQRKILMKRFIESQFSYCPFTWMFCGRKTNAAIVMFMRKL